MFDVSFSQASKKVEFFPWRRLNSFFLLFSSLLWLVQWFVWASYRVRFVLSFCLFVFPLMGKAEWGGTPVCWWLGLYFCFLCSLDDASCTGCYWWLGNAGSSIQVVSSGCVLTDTPEGQFSSSLGSWSQCCHSKGSGFDLWSETKIPQVVCYGIKGK